MKMKKGEPKKLIILCLYIASIVAGATLLIMLYAYLFKMFIVDGNDFGLNILIFIQMMLLLGVTHKQVEKWLK